MYVDDIKLAGKKQNIDPMWKALYKEVDLGEPTSFLDHENFGCTQRQSEISKKKKSGQLQNNVLNHEFPLGELKNYHTRKIFIFLRGPTIWKVMPRNVCQEMYRTIL